MESLPIPVGYGIELAVLLDTAREHGLDAIAQVDLGRRGHKHQASHDLALMAAELLVVADPPAAAGRTPAGSGTQRLPRPARPSSCGSSSAPAARCGSAPGPCRWTNGRRPARSASHRADRRILAAW